MTRECTEENIKFSCKGIQKDGNNVNYQQFHNVLFDQHEDKVLNKSFRYVGSTLQVKNHMNK